MTEESIYLKPRKRVLTVSFTNGKWDRSLQEKVFNKIDRDIEKWVCVGPGDEKTNAIKAQFFDLINKGTYQQLIPNMESNFFANLTQGLQIFKDNPFLIKEIREKNIRIMIPFISKSRKDVNGKPFCFVANIFRLNKKVELRVSKFTRNFKWTVYLNVVVIIPQYKEGIN